MSSTETIDFSSFLIPTETPEDRLRAEFADFCYTKAVESAFDRDSHLGNSPEWEYFSEEYVDSRSSIIADLQAARQLIDNCLKSSTSIRRKWCHSTKCHHPFFQVRKDHDGISYAMYRWILMCCLEFPAFALKQITAHAVIDDSHAGISVEQYCYTLENI